MMKKYELLEINVTNFKTQDVIRTSEQGSNNDWGIGELPFNTNGVNSDF